MKNENYRFAIAAAFAVYTMWGFSFLASTRCQEYASPMQLLMYRFDIAALVLLIPAILGITKISFRGKKLGLVLLIGLLDPVLNSIGEQYGLRFTNSSFTGISIAMIPVVAMLMASVILKERPTTLQWVFSVLSIGGVVAVTIATSSFDGVISLKGILFILLTILCGSSCSVVSSLCSNEFSIYERTLIMQLMGAVFFTALALSESRFDFVVLLEPIRHVGFVVPVLYLALFSSIVGYLLYHYAISYAPVTSIINFCNLTTVISVAAGVIILHEPFSMPILIGTLAVLVGVWGVQKFGVNR